MASTLIDNDKLMPWYYAVNWAGLVLEEHIKQVEALGLDVSLHKERLAQLEELKQFLDTSWTAWLMPGRPSLEVVK
jgi:hypothetical protein